MSTMRFRLSDEDRELYGGPEWIELDITAIDRMDANQAIEFEERSGILLTELGPVMMEAAKSELVPMKYLKAFVWLGRLLTGHVDDYGEFKPRLFQAKYELVGDDAEGKVPSNRAEKRSAARGASKRGSKKPSP